MTQTIDDAISTATAIYEQLTGRPPPEDEFPYATIPPEVDREEHVLHRASQLLDRIQTITAENTPFAAPYLYPRFSGNFDVSTPAGFGAEDPLLGIPLSVFHSPEVTHLVFFVPGVSKEHLRVEIHGSSLRVTGERQHVRNEANPAQKRERLVQTVELGRHVAPEAVDAELSDDLLTVRVRASAPEERIYSIEVR